MKTVDRNELRSGLATIEVREKRRGNRARQNTERGGSWIKKSTGISYYLPVPEMILVAELST